MIFARRFALPAALLAAAVITAGCGASSSGSSMPSMDSPAMSTTSPDPSMSGMAGMAGMTTDTGTAASSGGYTLKLATATAKPATPTTLTFTIDGPDGMPVTDYVVDQTKKLHLYLIRTDLTGFQHVHPALAADGTWSIRTAFAAAGRYRLVADFTVRPAGSDVTHILGAPLTVTGSWRRQPTPAPSSSVTVDGYTVEATGRLQAGTESALTVRLTRGGQPVTDLQPYLGVWAHLSAFRAGTLAFAHLHPTERPMSGMGMDSPDPLRFKAELPSAGTYRVYVQFQTGGALHTAGLTLTSS